MGVDLRLLVFDADLPGLTFSHTVLDLHRRRELWDAIEELPAEPVPPGFYSYCCHDEAFEDVHYGVSTQTVYGDPLLATTAGHLGTLSMHPGVQDNPKNRAAWSYLHVLPPQTRVALDWH